MELYLHAENPILIVQHGWCAAMNLLADTAVWFRAYKADLNSLSWDILKNALQ